MNEKLAANEENYKNPDNRGTITNSIGIFDSGIGGITVLANAIHLLPGEKFIYFGDSANAPYGEKDPETVKRLSMNAAKILMEKGIKALVVACNTATSVSIEYLRNNLSIPVIGMEPAVKPVVENNDSATVVVMATPLTLSQNKFNLLMKSYSNRANIIPLPCAGMAELIENGIWDEKELDNYLTNIFSKININDITDIVLGCTHYVFVKNRIDKFFNNRVRIIDGNEGTIRQLKKVLISNGLYKEDMGYSGYHDEMIEFYFSSPKDEILSKCKQWIMKQTDG